MSPGNNEDEDEDGDKSGYKDKNDDKDENENEDGNGDVVCGANRKLFSAAIVGTCGQNLWRGLVWQGALRRRQRSASSAARNAAASASAASARALREVRTASAIAICASALYFVAFTQRVSFDWDDLANTVTPIGVCFPQRRCLIIHGVTSSLGFTSSRHPRCGPTHFSQPGASHPPGICAAHRAARVQDSAPRHGCPDNCDGGRCPRAGRVKTLMRMKSRMKMKMRMRLKMGMVMFVFWRQLRDSYLPFRKKRNQQPGARLTMVCFTSCPGTWRQAKSSERVLQCNCKAHGRLFSASL